MGVSLHGPQTNINERDAFMSSPIDWPREGVLPAIRKGVVLSLAVTVLLAVGEAAAQSSTDEDAVLEAVSTFSQAFVAADVDALGALITEEYIHVNGGSGNVIGRDSWLSWVAQRREALEAGRLVVDDYQVGDLEVRLFGETAVVVGSVVSRGRMDGERFESRLRFTNVWISGESGWRRAAFHDSPF